MTEATRDRIHRLLLEAGEPVLVETISDALGVHHTTVRQHLTSLVDQGAVTVHTVHRTTRGRPHLSYQAIPSDAHAYRSLSTMLSEAVRDGVTAREAGRRTGRRLAGAAGGTALAAIEAEARRSGFDPVVRQPRTLVGGDVEVVLQRCPFADVAEVEPDVICDLHLGLAEGMVDALGGAEVVGLRVGHPRHGGCAVQLLLPDSADPGARTSPVQSGP